MGSRRVQPFKIWYLNTQSEIFISSSYDLLLNWDVIIQGTGEGRE
jgi:hypothetical protein